MSQQTVKFEVAQEETIVHKAQDQQIVYGWASVIESNGEVVVDSQEDMIDEMDIIKAAHDFMRDARSGKLMHEGDQIAEVVESVVLSRDLQKALGIDLGKAGWLIGMKVESPEIWKMVKDGTLGAFSIGGTAVREEIE